MTLSVQLVVTFADHSHRYFPLSSDCGWKVDAASRCLVVGQGLPRTYVPLDQVRSFSLEEYGKQPDADPPLPDPDGVCLFCSHPALAHSRSGCRSRSSAASSGKCLCQAPYGQRGWAVARG